MEDEIELQQNYKEILEFNGLYVITANNGIEALEKLENTEIDIIISDILMPKMDGIKFLTKVRQLKTHKNLPFIFMTAKIRDEEISLGINSGADDYLTKPVSGQVLLNSIFNCFRKQEIHKERLNSIVTKDFYENKFKEPIESIIKTLNIMESSLENFTENEFKKLIENGKKETYKVLSELISLQENIEKNKS